MNVDIFLLRHTTLIIAVSLVCFGVACLCAVYDVRKSIDGNVRNSGIEQKITLWPTLSIGLAIVGCFGLTFCLSASIASSEGETLVKAIQKGHGLGDMKQETLANCLMTARRQISEIHNQLSDKEKEALIDIKVNICAQTSDTSGHP